MHTHKDKSLPLVLRRCAGQEYGDVREGKSLHYHHRKKPFGKLAGLQATFPGKWSIPKPYKNQRATLITSSWWEFRPRKKIFSPPPPNSPQTPFQPLAPLPPPGRETPPPGIFYLQIVPPPAPRTPASPPPSTQKKKKSETSTESFFGVPYFFQQRKVPRWGRVVCGFFFPKSSRKVLAGVLAQVLAKLGVLAVVLA